MSYLFDTNVISALRRRDRVPRAVAEWARSVSPALVAVSVVTLLELERGTLMEEANASPFGSALRHWLEAHVYPAYRSAALPVTPAVALRAAAFYRLPTIELADQLIAATALVNDLTLVTRNTKHFAGTGVRLLNPWDA